MKPFRAFLFLSSVLILLFLVSLYRMQANQEEKFVLTPVPQLTHAVSTPLQQTSPPGKLIPDTAVAPAGANEADSLLPGPALKPQLPATYTSELEYAATDSIRLAALAHKLGQLSSNKEQVRIIYYGDSQIEGDQITSALRQKLQQHYGGHGPGLIAGAPYYNPAHQLIMTTSDNWKMIPIKAMGQRNKSVLFQNSLALAPQQHDCWFRINRLKFLNPQSDYQQVRLFYYANDSVRISCSNAARPVFEKQSAPTLATSNIELDFDQTPKELTIQFTAKDSLWIAGLSLDSPWGVFVDNIALRGQAFPPFSKGNKAELKAMMDQLTPDLFILQFGVNVVPYFTATNRSFGRHLSDQVQIIRELCPHTPIIIVGVSDMAKRENGEFRSYANIAQIKQVQRAVAQANQCLFWDLEAFMGGSGSMIRWVNSEPPLGRKDYIHFSQRGGEKIGNEIARLLISEFDNQQQLAWTNN
ncbi:GDSL-type esterase/lipase family protein [Mangrovibacterium marinum]|uniref:GDSL-like lipase/acylhydrolase family protein n=1 Tax=Mangrovibacterium marinum TaxID=1639118 RepID=A0A2T5C292_9BACT|nr:GDSL-type esterase/lipase family protein [Mangrovibacterium marinum]PTN08804.1 GDSL-like lipase/acylhydrolase family protein [Mangrovibacterium marinum]